MDNSDLNSTTPCDKPDLEYLQSLINDFGLELVKNDQAKFVYCGEGNNNIVVIFKIIDSSSTDPLMSDLTTYFDNKVLRIKK